MGERLDGGTARCINITTIPKENITSKYQLHSMIFYLLRLFSPTSTMPMPFPTQLLICSTSTTRSQIDAFLEFFSSRTVKNEKCIEAYYTYHQFPRNGKTQRIFAHIYENYNDSVYIRILVDESTTLTTLINRLNEVRKNR